MAGLLFGAAETTRKRRPCQFAAGGLKITNFLKDWLAKHIRETDKKYGPFLAATGGV
ncbi:MAG: hypothetical protein MUE48_10925 [Desulfobacterales bacterium]|nr:hypothetical protein [Desulfobacterales bacterium]